MKDHHTKPCLPAALKSAKSSESKQKQTGSNWECSKSGQIFVVKHADNVSALWMNKYTASFNLKRFALSEI